MAKDNNAYNLAFSSMQLPDNEDSMAEASKSGPCDFQRFKLRLPGIMTPKELQTTFENVGKHFSDASCKFIVRLFDLDKKGGLDVDEFEKLYMHVRTWVDAFNSYDKHRRGYLDEKELDRALKHMNIQFSNDFIKYLLAKCDETGKKMTMDKFIVTCIQIQKYSDVFNNLKDSTGSDNLNYGNFLETIMKCL